MGDCLAERSSRRFKRAFRNVVAVRSVMKDQVKIHHGVRRHRVPEFLNEFRVELTDLLRWEFNAVNKRESSAQVERRRDERLFHRQRHASVSRDALLIAQSFTDRAAETNSHVFHRVVMIDVKIPVCFHSQVEQPMPREERQHVVEEADAGTDVVLTGTVEV